MKLSNASGYAVSALAHLARHDGRLLPSGAIAEAAGLPDRFLVKVLTPLVRARVLYSVRGPLGGYRLARPAKGITLLEVVEAVDGPVRGEAPRWASRQRAGGSTPGSRPRARRCPT
jgi:Rrf2 family protein